MIRFLVGAACTLAVACGHHEAPPPTPLDGNQTFVAFPATFQSFRTWTSFHDQGPADDGTFPAAVLGPRTQYINHAPPHGASEFPVGTVIVEARESGDMNIFAGVKRGGDYNKAGAVKWEWFELTEDATTKAVAVLWRGTAPPAGGYGGGITAGCNECHVACGSTNDYVCSPELQLGTF